ncbi:MAG: sulfite exporter TauE/SafE family protein [Elusimicrobia bacterium]|nr:sulfite exporter TauE/SafE family protein [Elusimicrobiota bacterium]
MLEHCLIYLAIFFVALLYSSVGHGGASGYLAVLSIFGFIPSEMALSALILNLLVSAVSFIAFRSSGSFRFNLFWPFALSSIPFSFLGSLLPVSDKVYNILLSSILIFAAYRLIKFNGKINQPEKKKEFFVFLALVLGGIIGFLSGLIGIGGGIFLSPILILSGWADVKEAAAISALFIWVNSTAGILGRLSHISPIVYAGLLPLIISAFLGGLLGSRFGAYQWSHLTLRRLLGFVLLIAAFKLFYISF